MIKQVSFQEAKEFMDRTDNYLLLDVREEEEYITGHAIAAQLFTLADINEKTAMDMIPTKETPVLVYCRSGRRSNQAAHILDNLGYQEIYDMGGLIGWPYGLE